MLTTSNLRTPGYIDLPKTEANLVDLADSQECTFEVALASLDLDSGWYLDSGATTHVTWSPIHFTDLDPRFSGIVRTTQGQQYTIAGKGSANFYLSTREIKSVSGVLYVPSITKNLLSVVSLTSGGVVACFDETRCYLYSKKRKKVVV